MRRSLPPQPGPLGSFVALVLIFLFVGVIGSCAITIGIWPGELKLLAPLFCSDAQPDAFVVADTYSPQPGETVTNFSLYCMGPRGDATDKGFLLPFLAISAVNGVVLMTLGFIGVKLLGRGHASRLGGSPDESDDEPDLSDLSRPTSTSTPGPGSTAGPFVS